MTASSLLHPRDMAQRLAEAEATIEALLSGQIDAVVDSKSQTPVLLSKAQEALRLSEERYRRIVETANEGIWALDENGHTTFVNGQMARMLGYSVEAMLGLPMRELVGAEDRERMELMVEKGRRGITVGGDSALLRKDGSNLWVRISTVPIADSTGAYVGSLSMVTDRTQQRAAEEALRRSEEQYRQIVENTTDGIVTIDRAGLIVFVNGRFAEMLGYQPHEIIGVSAFSLMSTGRRAAAMEAFKRHKFGLKGVVDSAFCHRNGIEVEVNIAGSPILDAAGNPIGSLAVVRDVTEQRKLQSQLMVSDRMASVGTLAAGVAHEINNPLAAVMANLDYITERLMSDAGTALLQMDSLPREQWLRQEIKPCLDDAREAAERVRFIVRDLKIFSRAPNEDACTPVNVKSIMESSLRMAWNEIRHRAVLVKSYGRVPDVNAIGARLGQVFLNLIVNAAQAMQEGHAEDNEIRISTRLDGDRVIVEVADNGPGMRPETVGRVFDAFFTTKPPGAGIGLGLAICQRIVTDLGGELTVASEVGKGTTFRVSLPAAGAEASELVVAPVTPQAVRRGRILIVDDEEAVLRVLRRIMSAEHEVVATLDAREALALCARGETFDLILCDLMMPRMSGMELYAELARVAPAQAERMIFVTGGAFTEKARLFLSDPPKEQIEKPFNIVNLRAITQRYLR
ncbi:MAG: PAS domain S-box protein [Gemmatimonadota bacterium]